MAAGLKSPYSFSVFWGGSAITPPKAVMVDVKKLSAKNQDGGLSSKPVEEINNDYGTKIPLTKKEIARRQLDALFQ